MSEPRPLWLIVTPVYLPAPGGGAIYTDTLARALAADGRRVVVATEAFPGQPALERIAAQGGSVVIDRLFPCRAGRAEIDWRTYRDYARQNLQMLGLPGMLKRAAGEFGARDAVVLIHSSLFANPGVLPLLLGRLRRSLPGQVRLVADVRDPLFDAKLLETFARFDAVVGCSREIAERLRAGLPDRVAVQHIPIPFAPAPAPGEDDVAGVLEKYELTGTRYLLNPNGVTERKAYPLMLEVVRSLRREPGWENTVLATIGRSRDWSKRDDEATAEGVLRYLGPVPNATMLALAKGAKATLILSEVEGLPRSALETFALGAPLIVPDIAEFREAVPEAIAAARDPDALARQVRDLSTRAALPRYPLEKHAMAALLPAYRALEPIL
jgi:glycosyltransferase involved in cell wall biosynthesis